jgi:hypothetical protein
MYVKGRINWLINSFRDYQCGCGETELVCLEWYPHHKKIRNLVYRNSAKSKEREQALKLIEECKPLCRNCIKKQEYDALGFVL